MTRDFKSMILEISPSWKFIFKKKKKHHNLNQEKIEMENETTKTWFHNLGQTKLLKQQQKVTFNKEKRWSQFLEIYGTLNFH